MFRYALKGALARKFRLALTATAVVLGVAFVAGTLVLTDTLNATFDTIFSNAAQGVSVVVQGRQAFSSNTAGGSNAGERALVPDAVLSQVRSVPGVAYAAGSADGYVQLVAHGKALVNGGAPNLGTSWMGDIPPNPLHVISGAAPRSDGQVVVDEKSAKKFGLAVGDRIEAVVQASTVPVEVVGIVRFGANTNLAGATMTAFAPHQAQLLLLGQPGVWSTVQATARDGVSQQVLRDRVAAAVPDPSVQVLTQTQYVDQQSKQFTDQLKFFNVLLLVFAFIAVFVAVFIIRNTFMILVAQRTRELGLLRALGGSRRQVIGSVVLEAGLTGLVASVVGLGVGVAVAAGLRALVSALAQGLSTIGLQLKPRTVVVAVVVGVVVTVFAALRPAWRASRISPMAALRDEATPVSVSTRRTVIGVALMAVGGVVLAVSVSAEKAQLLGLGSLLVLIGVFGLIPALGAPVLGGIGRALPRLWGTTGRLAQENAIRNPKRTASTAGALMIGVALTTMMSVLASSIVTSANRVIDNSVGADFIIATKTFGPVPPTVAASLPRVPGVAAVTAFRSGAFKVGGSVAPLAGVTADTVGQTLRLHVTSGNLAALRAGQLLVDADTAKAKHWHVGSRVPVTFALTGKRSLTVGGVFARNQVAGNYLVGLDVYNANFRNRLDQVVAVKTAPGAALGDVRTGLASALKPYPALVLRDQTQFKQEQKRQINQLLSFILALLVLSIAIAWLGIVNTLALSVFERTREIGLLRAVGMARTQLRRMVRLEAVLIAGFGALLGVALGTGFGITIVQALKSQGIGTLDIPTGQLLIYLVVGVLAGVTAAWWPARRAARLNVLGAIAAE